MVDEVKNYNLVIAGSGGGGSKQNGGKEASDTLKSRSKLVFVDVIGEGQIGGLVDNERSVFFDDTPLKNSVGEYNFSDVSWAMSHGTQDQEPLSNGYIDNIEYVTSKNIKITNENPVSFTITDPNADAVRVILSVPALTHSDDKGNINGSSVSFTFDISVNNGAYISFANSEINGKTRSKYQKSFYGQLPLTDSNNNKAKRWTIRVRKTTRDSTSSSTQNDLYLDSYATIISSKLSYPNTAIFGASIDAEFFSSMPRRSYLVDGLLIKVPANRNSKTRTYDGVWNGQYKLESSDNPAWILYDIISNERYGLGQYIPAEFRNPARLYEIGKYCDEMVDDGFGGKEPRFSINTVISSLADAYQLLTDISSVFNGMIYWTGNDMGYMCDMPSEVSMLYNKSNIIGDISYQSSDRKDRHSVAVISYNNPERNYEMEQEYIEDQDLISRFGVRKTEITAFGCTTRGQAHRVGKWLLYTEKYQSSVITFNVGIDSAFVFPGDIIQIADPDRAGKRLGGRLFGFTDKSAVLDDNIDLSAFPNSTILVRANDGSLIKRKIKTSYVDNKTKKTAVVWETPIQKSVVKGAIWVISSPNLEPITARVVSVIQVDGKDTEYSISAIRHLESKFNYIESDIALEIPKTSLIEHRSIDGTNSVSIIGEKKNEQGITYYSINIQWEQVKNAQYYLVKYRKENGNWIELPHQNGLSINIDGVYSGKYEASVVAVSALGAKSRPVLSALTTIDGTASILPKIALLETKGVLFGIDLSWSFAQGTTGVAYTEIQQKISDGKDWEFLSNVVYPTKEYSLSGLTSVESRVFRVRIVDSFGVTSEWSDEVIGTSSADPQAVLDILQGQINESTLDNILTGKINTAINDSRTNAQNLTQEIANRANAIKHETQARTQALIAEAQARATAISNEAKARSAEINQRVIALNSEIGTTIASLQNGLTQEIQQRKDGDNSTISTLNAYKVSNDRAVANVLERVNVTTSNIASNASKITALQSALNTVNGTLATKASTSALNALTTCVTQQGSNITAISNDVRNLQSSISTVQNGLATKLDSSVISNYYTKAETDNVASGKIDEFKSTLNRNDNLLLNSAFNGLGHWVKNGVSNRSSLEVIESNKRYNQVKITPLLAQLDWKGIHQIIQNIDIINQYLQIRFIATSEISRSISVGIHYLSSTNAILQQAWLSKTIHHETECIFSFNPVNHENITGVRLIICERSDVHVNQPFYIAQPSLAIGKQPITTWSPSVYDNVDGINANVQAINTINSNVSNLNNTVTSQSQQLTQLRNDLNLTNANVSTKADASALNTLNNRVTQANDRITSESQKITALQNSLNTVNGTLNTKADSSALSTLDNRVSNIDGRVSSQANQITNLISRLDDNNLCLNPSMKENNIGWSSTAIRTSLDNEYVIELTNRDAYYTSPYITTANQGDKFFFGAKLKVKDSTHRMRVGLSGNYVSNNGNFWLLSFVKAPSEASNWIDVYGYLTVPSDLKNVKFWCGNEKTEHTAGNWYIKDVVFKRVDNALNGLIDAKADSSALNNLVTNVTRNTESITSQSSKITQLENSLNATNSNLSKKADSTALTALDNKVTQQGNSITSQTSQMTQLNNTLQEISDKSLWHTITQRTDFNTYKSQGYYFIQTTNTTNAPSEIKTQWIYLVVGGSNINRITQTAKGDANGKTYTRYSVGDYWSNWVSVADGHDISRINNAIDTKANASALNDLSSKVTQQGNNITAQASQITQLDSKINQTNQSLNALSSNVVNSYATKTELYRTQSEMTTALNSKVNQNDISAIIKEAQNGTKFTIDTTALDVNLYYPVIIGLTGHKATRMAIITPLGSHRAAWATHSGGTWSGTLIWTDQASGWGANARELVIEKFSYAWTAQSPIINVGQMTNSNYAYVFVRGGSKYNFYVDNGVTPILQTTEFTRNGQTVKPIAYNANLVPKSLNANVNTQANAINSLTTNISHINGQLTTQAQQLTTLTTTQNNQATTITQQTQTINGISAVRAVTVDNNGVISGYGLMSELRNGRVTSQFGVNADTFYIGSPSNNKKPFIFNTSPRVINGVNYPAGAWINSAYIANATIKMAHIDKASISSLSALTATIGTLRTKTTGARTEIKDNLIEVYDENNRLRVKLGVW